MPRHNGDNTLVTFGCLLVALLLITCSVAAMYVGYMLAALDNI